jgi:trimeric autotransporter adhesin
MMDYRGYGQGGSSSSAHTGGFYYGVVKAVDGDTVTVQVPRLFGGAQIPGIPVVGATPSVDDSVFISFIEGRRGALLAFPVEAATGDLTAVAAGTNLNGGGTSGGVTLNLDTTLTGLTSVTSTTFVGALTGNAATASAVAASALTGATLAAGVTASSLTSVGTLSALTVNVGTDNTVILAESTDAIARINMKDDSTSSSTQVGIGAVGDDLSLWAGGSKRITAKSDGKVGIGLTSPENMMHVLQSGFQPSSNDDASIQVEGNWGGGITFAENANRTMIYSPSGEKFAIRVGATASGGGTEAFYITNTGNVGIGTNSPTHELTVDGDISLPTDGSVWIGGTGQDLDRLRLHHASSTGHAYIDYRDNLYFRANGNGSAMVLDSAGRVGIGGTAPLAPLHIYNTNPKIWLQDSSSATDSGGSLNWYGSGGANLAQITLDGVKDMRIYSGMGTGGTALYFNIGNAWQYYMTTGSFSPYYDNSKDLGQSGKRFDDVYATNGTIQTSDRRDKKDIVDLDLGLDFIRQLRPVSFVWDDRSGYEGNREHMGFIAQELSAVLGDQASDRAVWIDTPAGTHDNADPDGDPIPYPDRQGIRYEELVAPVIKAIQELSTRVAALETV